MPEDLIKGIIGVISAILIFSALIPVLNELSNQLHDSVRSIKAPIVWEKGINGSGVNVAIIEKEGVDNIFNNNVSPPCSPRNVCLYSKKGITHIYV